MPFLRLEIQSVLWNGVAIKLVWRVDPSEMTDPGWDRTKRGGGVASAGCERRLVPSSGRTGPQGHHDAAAAVNMCSLFNKHRACPGVETYCAIGLRAPHLITNEITVTGLSSRVVIKGGAPKVFFPTPADTI